MSVTLHDVARVAGVSIKTVSNVINAYPHIRPATKERVEAAIAELGYTPNLTARSLRSGRSGAIALAVPDLSLAYFAELAASVIAVAEASGLVVLVEQTGADPTRERELLRSPRLKMTDGLLFSPLGLGQDDVGVLDVDYPLVLLGERIFDGPVDHVTMQNVAAARAATEHLIVSGRRRIAIVGAHEGEVIGSAGLRLRGYREALAAHGIEYDEAISSDHSSSMPSGSPLARTAITMPSRAAATTAAMPPINGARRPRRRTWAARAGTERSSAFVAGSSDSVMPPR